jgi:hypothetical protein
VTNRQRTGEPDNIQEGNDKSRQTHPSVLASIDHWIMQKGRLDRSGHGDAALLKALRVLVSHTSKNIMNQRSQHCVESELIEVIILKNPLDSMQINREFDSNEFGSNFTKMCTSELEKLF